MAELGAGSNSGYPGAIDTKQTFANKAVTIADGPTRFDAEVLNDMLDAIVKIQTELGITPSGSSSTVADRFSAAGDLTVAAATELTISSGAVTVTQTKHTIDTESDASTDNLDQINGMSEGHIVILSSHQDTRDVTLRDSSSSGGSVTGNLFLNGDFTMDRNQDMIMLIKDADNHYIELCRSPNRPN